MEENEVVQAQETNTLPDFLNNPDFVEIIGEKEQVQETVQEQAQETVPETKTEEVSATETNTEDEIEDRIVGLQTQEKVETIEEKPKTEKKVELKKATVPFKNETQKIVYNYLQENDGNISEIASIINQTYNSLSPEQLIEFDVRNNPKNIGAPERIIRREINAKIEGIRKENTNEDGDLDESAYNEDLSWEASQIKKVLESKRNEIISKYSTDVEIEYKQESEDQLQPTEEELLAEKESMVNEATQKFQEAIKESFVKVEDKDGPINIPLADMKTIAESAVDPIGFIKSKFTDSNGVFNFGAYAKWVNYALNPEAHDNLVIKRGIALGRNGVVKGLKNTSIPEARPTMGTTNSGIDTDLGLPTDMNGFLQAATNARIVK